MSADPLEDVFTLEDRFYSQGYNQGLQDGAKAGRIEGRSFGMEKGFEKFLQAGRLAGRSTVWLNRLPANNSGGSRSNVSACTLPPVSQNARLEKNIKVLHALVEPDTLSTQNTDEAVQDFDERVKQAQNRAKIIERTLD